MALRFGLEWCRLVALAGDGGRTVAGNEEWLPVPRDGWLVPQDAPGFGIDVREEQIRAFDYAR